MNHDEETGRILSLCYDQALGIKQPFDVADQGIVIFDPVLSEYAPDTDGGLSGLHQFLQYKVNKFFFLHGLKLQESDVLSWMVALLFGQFLNVGG